MSLQDEVRAMLDRIELESPTARQHGLMGADALPSDLIEFANHLAAQNKILATICLRLAKAVDALTGDGDHPDRDD